MAATSDFYFGLLRVSMIQLLKSHGFDRAKPSTIDIITDLYIRYLRVLTSEIIKSAQSRLDWDDTLALQDLTLGLQNLGIIKPVDVLDVYDENPNLVSDEGMRKLKEWCVRDRQPADARKVALPSGSLLRSNSKGSKPPSLIPEYINQLQHGGQGAGDTNGNEEDKLVEELINNGDVDDWIRLVLSRQRINHAKRATGKEPQTLDDLSSVPGFKHSVLNANNISASGNQTVPDCALANSGEEASIARKGTELLQKLPVMRPEWKLENLSLSFDKDEGSENNEDLESLQNDSAVDDIPTSLPPEEDFDDLGTNGSNFILGDNTDTQIAEMEDMDNTFQRRESLDFGNTPHALNFEYNGF
ncbi:hypothetical protein HG536_0B05930 [Torulaspora globosa]|uniref:Bromodomain associated domain-containing protein n=1 Tax=Torulaspora globosa TaxID=48254 RepID=A0A7G3ZDZ1_9SACH|nr:uncharacterized protein HG536_0B05930 [Torulaspora globosa]QLL31727.1 hypothetical protein HG536_0B05930 [Torulaspora globosa]